MLGALSSFPLVLCPQALLLCLWLPLPPICRWLINVQLKHTTNPYFPLTFQDWCLKTPQVQYIRTESIISPFPQTCLFYVLSVSMTPALSPSQSSDLTLQPDISLSLLRCFPQEICCTFNSIFLSVSWTNTQGKQKPSLGDEATMKYSEYYNRSHWAWSLDFHRQGCWSLEILNWDGTEQDLSSSKFISITSVALPHLAHSW